MMSINDNDLCYCKSGRKYKNCCKKQVEIFNQLPSTYQNVDEQYILKELLNKKPKFKSYFNFIKFRLDNPILWFTVSSKFGANKRALLLKFGEKFYHGILVGKAPIKAKEYIEVAHELTHLLCGEEGFPSMECEPSEGTMPNTLLNVLADPIVNKRLVDYGFKFEEYYKFTVEGHSKIIGEYQDTLTTNQELWNIFVCVEKMLDGDLIHIQEKDNPIYLLVINRYPQLKTDILDLFYYIQKKDFYKIEIAKNIYNYIIEKYNLKNRIILTYKEL